MWSNGIIEIDGTKVNYEVKNFEKGSDLRIDGGRISKLECQAKVHAACESAKQNPGEENSFRQLCLNQWVKQVVR